MHALKDAGGCRCRAGPAGGADCHKLVVPLGGKQGITGIFFIKCSREEESVRESEMESEERACARANIRVHDLPHGLDRDISLPWKELKEKGRERSESKKERKRKEKRKEQAHQAQSKSEYRANFFSPVIPDDAITVVVKALEEP